MRTASTAPWRIPLPLPIPPLLLNLSKQYPPSSGCASPSDHVRLPQEYGIPTHIPIWFTIKI